MADGLVGDFPPVTLEEWREKALAKGDPDDPMVTALEDGVAARWLYTPADELAPDPAGAPGQAPFVRGVRTGRPWDIRQEHAAPERAQANAEILEDLQGGATGVSLRLDRAARAGIAPGDKRFAAQRGRDGVAVSTLDDLDEVLDEVLLDLAPVALQAGAQAVPAAALLAALIGRREVAPEQARGALRVDPVGTLAGDGALAGTPEDALAQAAALAAEVHGTYAHLTALAVDTRPFVDAGATAVEELAIAISTATTYLRACDAAGLPPADAAGQIELTLAVGADQFLELAKLRAARRMWARVLEACGVPAARRWSPLYARTSTRMLAAVDPWVNMLRVTTAAFAAATGGADGISVTPFDAVLEGEPGHLGRRVARNTQLVLAEECQLARVADPGGGSWYVEALTDQLARAAWARLQELEADGGTLAALRSGALAEVLARSTTQREEEIAHRARVLTGVNQFALLDEKPVARPPAPDLAELAAAERTRLAGDAARSLPDGPLLAGLVALAQEGARIDELAAALGHEPHTAAALPVRRESETFERLRAAAAEAAPRIFLACVGPLARYTSVALWARSFFEAGGLKAQESGTQEDARGLAGAFRDDGAKLVAVCADAEEEPEVVEGVVDALREAGAERVYLARATAAQAEAAGADQAVRDGQDMVAVLREALQHAGVELEERSA